jgi:primosomal protein N' (replication factor Y)
VSDSLWSVAVDVPLPRTLTYACPLELVDQIHRGLRATVPLGKRKSTGVILGPSTETLEDPTKIKSILEIDSEYPVLPEAYLRWMEWVSSYYLYPIGQVAEMFYPPLARTSKTRGSQKQNVLPQVKVLPPKHLNPEQDQVFKSISDSQSFSTHLVFGVTGSGKTEVYLELLDHALKQGKSGLVLVPEISLTPQLVRRFIERFGDQVAAIHSHLTPREKTEQWWSIIEGKKKILVGARSALFCPMPDLGLIVVDEEHESSYKQDEKLKYHARDAAIVLGAKMNCPVVLGSATPSIESWKNALDGKYQLHTLRQRFGNQPLPNVQIIDLRGRPKLAHLPDWMTEEMHLGIETAFKSGFQSALF